jgi:hypothetical protein
MTDLPAPPPPRDPDDVASDVVDGLLPPNEAELVQRDPAIAERVRRILQVRAALREVPPAEPQAANQAIDAALDAFDGPPTGQHSAPPPPPLRSVPSPGSIPPARPLGRDRRGPGGWLVAAAVLVVALVTIGLLAQSGGDSNDETASDDAGAGDRTSQSAETESGGEVAEAPDPDSPAAADEELGDQGRGAAVTHLGEVTDADELATRVATSLTGGPSLPSEAPADSGAADVGSCPGLTVAGDASRGALIFVADANLDGAPVRVHLYQFGDEQQLVATDQSCTDVVDEPFDV